MHSVLQRPTIPPRALILSLAALAVPVAAPSLFPESAAEYEVLFWLLALVPAFLFAYYRGWRGVALSLAAGMALLSCTQAVLVYVGGGLNNWPLLLGTVVIYLAVSLGVGWVSELLHRAREEAVALAFTDELTGLANRRLAMHHLGKELAAAQRGRPLVVALFDLDHFKRYNDAHGHMAGDEALRIFAQVLSTNTRQMNLSARLGGDEFLSILSEADIPGALAFANRVRTALAKHSFRGAPLMVTVGLASYDPGMRAPEELVDTADQALYQAKAGGRNCVVVRAPEPHSLASLVAP
jgi:diguanylate cyclase (GGDEF)-like protein